MWYYTIVANMAHTELIIIYQPFWIMPIMDIIYYIVSNYISEIIFNQEVIGIVEFILLYWFLTYIWYYNIVANMAPIELIIACQPYWIMSIMNIIYCIAYNSISETIFSQRNHWYGTIYITTLDFHIYLVLQDCSKHDSHWITSFLSTLMNHAHHEYSTSYRIQLSIR